MPGRIPMTARQRATLLALPDSEAMVVRHHCLDAEDLAAVGNARTPATRLGYALQLCCLRYPGRHLRQSDLLPAIMLEHIAEQVGVEAQVITDFARRTPTRYDQLAAIKMRFGFTDLGRPNRVTMMMWLEGEAMPIVDGRVLLDRLLGELRARRIVIPGVSVVERMAAEAMHRAETDLVVAIDGKIDADARQRLDTLIDDKVHDRQSRLSWLREPGPRRVRLARRNPQEGRADPLGGRVRCFDRSASRTAPGAVRSRRRALHCAGLPTDAACECRA